MDEPASKKRRRDEQPWYDQLVNRCAAVSEELAKINKELEERIHLVKKREDHLAKVEAMMEENAAAAKERIKLDVGGRIFSTSKNTLLRCEGTYFHALLCSGKWEPEEGGAYFIDRDPRFFDRIMASLRTGTPVDMSGLLPSEAKALREEMDYYMMGTNDIVSPEVRWDSTRCGQHLNVTDDGRTVTKKTGGNVWDSAVIATTEGDNIPSFQIRNRGSGHFMVGYVKANQFKPTGCNYTSTGWFFYAGNQALYSCAGETGRSAGCRRIENGDLIKVSFNKDSRQIKFEVNGQAIGSCFDNVHDGGPLVPCIDFLDRNASVTIVD